MEKKVSMSEALGILRRLTKMHSDRTWTLQELAGAADRSLTDAKIAAERLVIHGELVRSRRGGHYTRPVMEDESVSAGSSEMA